MSISTRLVLALGAATACLAAAAQTPGYDSAFAGYKAYTEPQLVPWRETNEKITTPAHTGHRTLPAKVVRPVAAGSDPHAGHALHAPKEAPKAAAPAKAKADPHAAHNH